MLDYLGKQSRFPVPTDWHSVDGTGGVQVDGARSLIDPLVDPLVCKNDEISQSTEKNGNDNGAGRGTASQPVASPPTEAQLKKISSECQRLQFAEELDPATSAEASELITTLEGLSPGSQWLKHLVHEEMTTA